METLKIIQKYVSSSDEIYKIKFEHFALIGVVGRNSSVNDIVFERNCVCLCPPKVPLSFFINEGTVYSFEFDINDIYSLSSYPKNLYTLKLITDPIIKTDINFQLSDYFLSAYALLTKESSLTFTTQLFQLIILLESLFSVDFNVFNEIKNHSPNALIYSVLEIINKEFSENITLTSIANRLFINPSYLSSTFHKKTGFKFNEYLNSVRLSYAKKLLTETNYLISDISLKAGFNSTSYFVYIFKKTNNISPFTYRQRRLRQIIKNK